MQSYLFLKYGITYNNGLTDYIATDGTTKVWDATANSAYKNNIAGIGRVDEEALQQKQSRSINTGTQVTIGLGSIDSTNSANPNTFVADKSYLIWGDDAGSVAFRTAFTGSSNINYRMTRVWKVQETGTVGNVQLAVSKKSIPINASNYYLVVSNDNVLDGSDNMIPLSLVTLNGDFQFTASVDFTDGQYFSIGAYVTSPGAVAANLVLWNKADDGDLSGEGVAVNTWRNTVYDQGYYDVTQSTAANQPLYYATTFGKMQNFNPALQFDGTNDFIQQ